MSPAKVIQLLITKIALFNTLTDNAQENSQKEEICA